MGCEHESQASSCAPKTSRDWLLISTSTLLGLMMALHVVKLPLPAWWTSAAHFATQMMLKMSWGLALGIVFVALLDRTPRALVVRTLGQSRGFRGIYRATLLGLFLDLCSHGILLVGMRLYKQGATLGQTMAFLIASPWNSLSLTVILISLIGIKWTLFYILGSAVIALVSGLMFDRLETAGHLPANPSREAAMTEDTQASFSELFKSIFQGGFSLTGFLKSGFSGSRMILRWIFLGVLMAAFTHALVPDSFLQGYFGPTVLGSLLTVVATAVIEVCSEGSAPLAVELVQRAKAPGNGFIFLMGGVSTDVTEILAIRETTGVWRTALWLPIITLPQIIILGILMNMM